MPPKIIGNQMQMGQLNSFVLIQNQDGSWSFGSGVDITGSLFITSNLTVDGTIFGGDGSGENLTLGSTSHATKGKILAGPLTIDEVNNRVGINDTTPSFDLEIGGSGSLTQKIISSGASDISLFLANSANSWELRNTAAGHLALFRGGGTLPFIVTGNAPVNSLRVEAEGVSINGSGIIGTNGVGVLAIKNGTAPTTGPADSVQLYSSDDAAGHTIPSFYCEGTNVVATGQADIASSVRVKMRINGTVRTFLCI